MEMAVVGVSAMATASCVEAMPPLHATLSAPVEQLLRNGGDTRLNVGPARGLNRYGCRSWPNPQAFSFASSTASNISSRGFAAAAEMRQQLLRSTDANAFDELTDQLREQIRETLHLERSGVEIVFSPSGTDSEIHALFIAQTVLGDPLVNVIVGSDETGSGVAEAARGRHFNSVTALGEPVTKGERIPEFSQNVENISIPFRNAGSIEDAVTAAVADSVASGKRVVLHLMDHSKFGWNGPSPECVRHIQDRWGHSVQVVVDACQMRLSRTRLAHYLSQGFLVLITGSKFFAGPPFSGALLVPEPISAVMRRTHSMPSGLRLYSHANDWPASWTGVRAQLPSLANVGQLLRWSAAAEEMRAYFAAPLAYRWLALQRFASTVEACLAERPNFQLLPPCPASRVDCLDNQEMAVRTIFPFFLYREGKRLSLNDCNRIYHSLQSDLSYLTIGATSARQEIAASTSCQIGQPVLVLLEGIEGAVGTLRISADARLVSETWCAGGETESLDKLEQRLEQVRLVCDKIDLLVDNLDTLSGVAW